MFSSSCFDPVADPAVRRTGDRHPLVNYFFAFFSVEMTKKVVILLPIGFKSCLLMMIAGPFDKSPSPHWNPGSAPASIVVKCLISIQSTRLAEYWFGKCFVKSSILIHMIPLLSHPINHLSSLKEYRIIRI